MPSNAGSETVLPPSKGEPAYPHASGAAEGSKKGERFTVRWYRVSHGRLRMLPPGYAVFDGEMRITNTFPTRAEAEQHRDNIARIFARYGW